MFAVGIHYLSGVVRATHPADREQVEWPPHPDRVFMALVAALFETGDDPEERAALQWLEQQGNPEVTASEHNARSIVTSFVPVNDDASPWNSGKRKSHQPMQDLGIGRNRQSRVFPATIPDDPTVYLTWPRAAPTDQQRVAMRSLCAKVTYVGHSASFAQLWVEDHPPDANWLPIEGANGIRMRVSGSGRLTYLQSQFNAAAIEKHYELVTAIELAKGKQKVELKKLLADEFGDEAPQSHRPAASLWHPYSPKANAERGPAIPCSNFDHNLVVLRRVGGRQFGLESTLQITAALRDTVMSTLAAPLPEWISGHRQDGTPSDKPHLAFIALANVGFEHSNGGLLGAAIVVPREIAASEMKLLRVLTSYDDRGEPTPIKLTFGVLGEWILQLEDRECPPVTLQEAVWTKPARRWSTVTPIVFDRHPKSTGEKRWIEVENMIAVGCERIGLPRPRDVVLSPVSMFIGTPHARRMPLIQRKGGGNLHHTHAIITFEQPVQGPVLLGAGRYRGYGLCRPLCNGGEA